MTHSPKSLQKVIMKGEKTTHIALRTGTYLDDMNQTTEDDKYPWLDTNKRQNMTEQS